MQKENRNKKNKLTVTVVGAGLAGCEAAYQITRFNVHVKLIEMKPEAMTAAHRSANFGELVCSNSLKAKKVENANGLLKQEMRTISSLVIEAADHCSIPAGGALAVDREKFSRYITEKIKSNPLIDIEERTLNEIPEGDCVIIATGPLTAGNLFEDIKRLVGTDQLSFYDAASPIVHKDSIDMGKAFMQSRYNKGTDDYINCSMDREEYEKFRNEIIAAELAQVRDFEDKKIFEGCMPIEIMAKRGIDTMRFGPLKPVGLVDPKTGKEPYACVQLRQDNESGSLYNMVGFQTRLTFNEQKRVFRMIPGLENCEFARYGVMHRNSFIKSPKVLDATYHCTKKTGLFFAGQITGVEGYNESASSGMIAGINAALYIKTGKTDLLFPSTTVSGALAGYISDASVKKFQPMGANFGIVDPLERRIKNKEQRNAMIARRALEEIQKVAYNINRIIIRN